LLLLLIVFNTLVLLYLGKLAIKYLLFPYGQWLVKHEYHQGMNLKMVKEIEGTIEKVLETLEQMSDSEFKPSTDIDRQLHQLRKLIDYFQLFSEVN